MEVLESLAIVMVTMQLTMMKTKDYKKFENRCIPNK